MEAHEHILKTREDASPIRFRSTPNANGPADVFEYCDDDSCSWLKNGETFGPGKLRPRIEPWLTALFQSEHLGLLIGSGLSHAVHWIATEQPMPGMSVFDFQVLKDQIAAGALESAKLAGRDVGNIEDQVRVGNELLRGLEILRLTKKDEKSRKSIAKLRSELELLMTTFANSILQGEAAIVNAPTIKRELAFNYLVSFLMSFASRAGTRDRLQMFTTNYDRIIEAGADLAGLHLMDRFVGALAPVFRSSRLDVDMHYNPPGIRGEPRYLEGVAKFTKLHGSVDWINAERSIRRIGLPLGAEGVDKYLAAPGLYGAVGSQVMIYPNAAKDWETTLYPYADLFRDLAAAVCRPNSTLITFGYSFGDDHINRVIEDMLTIPSSHLVIVSYGDPLGRILRTYEKIGRHAQITLLLGPHLGDLRQLVDHYLPKPAIDRTTFRMAELLKARWSASASESKNVNDESQAATGVES